MSDQYQDGYEPEQYQSDFPPAEGAAPPTEAGDFVPVKPPEGWPTVMGVLAIIFGSLATLQGFCGLLSTVVFGFFMHLFPQEMQDEMGAQMQQSLPYPAAQAAQVLVEFALGIVLLIGGIMLVKRKPGSRKLLMGYAWLDLASNTYVAVLGYFVFQATVAAMEEDPELQQAGAGFMVGMMQSMGVVFVAVGWLFTAIWPVFLLIWFSRAKVRESVANWG